MSATTLVREEWATLLVWETVSATQQLLAKAMQVVWAVPEQLRRGAVA
jgi:hypothetical protein